MLVKLIKKTFKDYFTFENSLEGTLVLRKALDFETLPNFTIGLRAQDQGNPPNFSDTVLYVEVLDSDDQNPKFLDDGYTAILPDRVSQVVISLRYYIIYYIINFIECSFTFVLVLILGISSDDLT